MRNHRFLALGLAGALAFAACADKKDDVSATSSTAVNSTKPTAAPTTSTTLGKLEDLGHGVTAKEIKIGIAYIDYKTIAEFVDFTRGDQETIAQAFVDDINASGGILGRKIVPIYKKYIPIPGSNLFSTTTCTELTDDEDVFAVVGVVFDNTGQSQLCLSKDHETIHIGHELRDAWQQQAKGLLLTPDFSLERRIRVTFALLKREGTLSGAKRIATLTDQNSAELVKGTVNPALDDLGIEKGTAAVLTISGEDTSEAQGQLDTFIATWKSEGVDVLVTASENVISKQFIEKIKKELPDVRLIAAVDTGVRGAAQDETAAGKDPNPYEGVLTVAGGDEVERWNSPKLQACRQAYEGASGKTVDGPADAKKIGDDRDETYVAVTDFCGELGMFKTIAERVGTDLTNENWIATVNGFGPIEVIPTDIASLGDGKYAADDAMGLVEWDSTLADGKGGWKYLTEVEDMTGLG